jgi:hypothetical protein
LFWTLAHAAKVNPTYTVHLEGECTLNDTPETKKDIQEHPRAPQLIKASKDLIKGFSSATVKLRYLPCHIITPRVAFLLPCPQHTHQV